MRRFMICSGVYGRAESLEWLETAVRRYRPEGILFAGGVLDRGRSYEPTPTTSWGHTKDDVFFLERFFSSLGRLGVFTAVIPGTFDAPLDLFLRLGMRAELEYPQLHLVHGTPVEEKDVAIFGLGACIADYTATDIGYYSLDLAEYYFRPLLAAGQSRTVLLLPEPPAWRSGDPKGTQLVESLITTYRPGVCVLGRPGHRPDADRIGGTLVINPGSLCDGSAAWLDWDLPACKQVEILDLRTMGTQQRPSTQDRVLTPLGA